jgi:hypothetical protein
MTDKWIDGQAVPMTPKEQADFDAFQQAAAQQAARQATLDANADSIRDALKAQMQNALQLADALDANTATPAQQRQALAICLRGVVRLAKVVYQEFETGA